MIDSISYKDGKVHIIDQTQIPVKMEVIELENVEQCYDAIKKLKVRGAPAIGVAAGYGMVLSNKNNGATNFEDYYQKFKKDAEYLNSSRPTAVNLSWALKRINNLVLNNKDKDIDEIKKLVEQEAINIHKEDIETCRLISKNGATLLKDGMTILTHCNAGRLAVSKYGTALGPIYYAKEQGMDIKVYADETRPLLQGSRLTCFELMEAGVDVTLITDNMAATVMKSGKIDAVFLGCDRIAANGDVANKIGTYGVAILAKHHNIPFYTLGPLSTIDLNTATGEDIIIEERDPDEVRYIKGVQVAPKDVKVYNPAFDVTPHELVSGIITEKGIVRAPFKENIKKLFEK